MFLLPGAVIVRRCGEVCAVAQLLTPFPGEAVTCLRIKGPGSLILQMLRNRVVSYSAKRNRHPDPPGEERGSTPQSE